MTFELAIFYLLLMLFAFWGPIGALLAYAFRDRVVEGYLLGLLGPLGVVGVAALEDRRIKCPSCASTVRDIHATDCRNCGSQLLKRKYGGTIHRG